ncbi:SGNH/GDSL hydrolase family protein [Candidatus Omnitrophota bacterium]
MTIKNVLNFLRILFLQAMIICTIFFAFEVLSFVSYYFISRNAKNKAALQSSSVQELKKIEIARYPYYKYAKGFAKFTGIHGYDIWLAHRLVPNSTQYGKLRVDEYGFISNNNRGISEADLLNPPPAGYKRIIILGGSTVAGCEASSNKDTIAANLQDYLNRQSGLYRYQVINAGVHGYTSSQSFVYTAMELIHYYPDIIVTFDGLNDCGNSYFAPLYVPNRSTNQKAFFNKINELSIFQFLTRADVLSFLPYFFKRGKFFARLYFQYGNIPKLVDFFVNRKVSYAIKYQDNEEGIKFYGDSIVNMSALLSARGIKYYAILQPQLSFAKNKTDKERGLFRNILNIYPDYQEGVRAFYTKATQLYEQLHNKVDNNSTIYVRDFSRLFKSYNNTTLYSDPGHYTDEANAIIAQAIGDLLINTENNPGKGA